MTKTILILVAVIAVFGFGSAAALIIPIDLQTTDNVKIYTKNTDFGVLNIGLHEISAFCDDGDTFISGDIQTDGRMSNGVNGFSITSATAEGYTFLFDIFTSDPVKGILVCAKIVPSMGDAVGGFLLQPDDTALFLAYGIANSVWMAPLAIGIGAGIYLTKNKWKR